ncbi:MULTISPECIES: translation initiation factor Sui1 [Halomonas]|uniref:translation initiation factor Sui1 n=1 Tax=Halomonas TaxID=2745 RepID=UPI001C950391|nr:MULTISPECIES: translation initiation factor Sui1 [Halomonas]MBY6205991.1 translation initiation factor Sui1 [Halomonas sp. DP3Y7-2]MBY6228118.1 translation initiation factor Sui1 [Halomonas sp. DP3Y7-1]MCA0916184.1 translation initiation factor Sui1 [Halomonas denitrificans]
MPSLKDQLGSLVYSTEHGDICPQCRAPKEACRCDEIADQARLEELDGIVRIRRETSGRKGKGVTTISGVPLAEKELKALAKELKKRCGTGGALKNGIIEIQGDHRQVLKEALEKKGFKVKLAGG